MYYAFKGIENVVPNILFIQILVLSIVSTGEKVYG